MGTSEENSETISRRGGQNSLEYYASSTILRNYPARQGIMLGNGWAYLILGRTEESVDKDTPLLYSITLI